MEVIDGDLTSAVAPLALDEPARVVRAVSAARDVAVAVTARAAYGLDLALRRIGLRCVAATIASAQTRDAWLMIAADFASAHGRTGDSSNRRLLSASAEAAEDLAKGHLVRALHRLAQSRGVDVPTWLSDVRDERAAKGGA